MSETLLLGSALSSDRSSHQSTQETSKMLDFYAKWKASACDDSGILFGRFKKYQSVMSQGREGFRSF